MLFLLYSSWEYDMWLSGIPWSSRGKGRAERSFIYLFSRTRYTSCIMHNQRMSLSITPITPITSLYLNACMILSHTSIIDPSVPWHTQQPTRFYQLLVIQAPANCLSFERKSSRVKPSLVEPSIDSQYTPSAMTEEKIIGQTAKVASA